MEYHANVAVSRFASCASAEIVAFGVVMPPKKPLYGYCQTKACAKAKRAAQSGLDNFCKRCYAKKFPEEYEEMKKARNKTCDVCRSQLQLRKGICKPCWASRGCAISGCDWINKEPDAAQCINCQQDKSSTTAKHVRVAMRCPDHATIEQGESNLCHKCFEKQAKEADDVAAAACHHCALFQKR
jgi:hypothetical protein